MKYSKTDLVEAIWKCYDHDGNGYLEKEELDKFLKDICTSPKLKGMEKMIKNIIDANKNGVFEKQEMLNILED